MVDKQSYHRGVKPCNDLLLTSQVIKYLVQIKQPREIKPNTQHLDY